MERERDRDGGGLRKSGIARGTYLLKQRNLGEMRGARSTYRHRASCAIIFLDYGPTEAPSTTKGTVDAVDAPSDAWQLQSDVPVCSKWSLANILALQYYIYLYASKTQNVSIIIIKLWNILKNSQMFLHHPITRYLTPMTHPSTDHCPYPHRCTHSLIFIKFNYFSRLLCIHVAHNPL